MNDEKDAPIDIAAFYAEALERGGWLRSIAGDTDFDKAVAAAVRAWSAERKKGIIVSGGYGAGKTSFIRALPKGETQVIDCAFRDEVSWLDSGGSLDTIHRFLTLDVVLDDLGAESLVSAYGVRLDLVGEFIIRYHRHGKKRLFITTNLSGEELAARYGGRVMSRLKELCVPLKLDGKDKRKWEL